ncbi:MAG TPA: hypothetical protein VGJ31_03270 [Dongiaceae bacterium]
MLVGATPEGAVIGIFAGKPISERVVDRFGRRFRYVGVAIRARSGECAIELRHRGEFIVEPGLVYCLEDKARSAA